MADPPATPGTWKRCKRAVIKPFLRRKGHVRSETATNTPLAARPSQPRATSIPADASILLPTATDASVVPPSNSATPRGVPNDAPAHMKGAHNTGDASRHVHLPTSGEGDLIAGNHTRQPSASAPLSEDWGSQILQDASRADTLHTPDLAQGAVESPEHAFSLGSLHTSGNATKWHEALQMFKRSNKIEYEYLDSKISQTQTTQGGDIKWTLPKHLEQDPKSNEIIRRAKRWLPTLASVRSVVMPIAALDPHKIAPICCAIILAIPELAVNGPDTEYRSKALDAYFEAANTINDWISFEMIFAVEREDVVSNLKSQLPDVYIMALRLMCHIHSALDKLSEGSKADRVKAKAAAMMKNDPGVWDEKVKDLRRAGEEISREKKRTNDKIAADEKVAAALKWFKKKDDPEDALSKIEKEITSDGRSKNYAQWFLESSEYKTWFEAVRRHGDDNVQFRAPSPARILWIAGPFGMGKTTLAHRVLLSLKALESIPVPGESLRVVHYFCSARGSSRPDHETVIRSLILKLSWGLDCSIAPKAYQFYCKWTRGPEDEPSIDDWKSLLDALIAKSDLSTKLVILVDGLDAFEKTEEGQLFLESMKSVAKDHSHVFFVFSSHQYVLDSSEYDESLLVEYKVNPEDTRRDLEAFVDTEIEARAPAPGETVDVEIGPVIEAKERVISIFFQQGQEKLRDTMRQLLLDRANGMFVWVKIWLQILLPERPRQKIVLTVKHAEELLDQLRGSGNHKKTEQLQTAYQRLWDRNEYESYLEIRRNLFRFVLCWRELLSVKVLTKALQINGEGEDLDDETLPEKRIRDLGADFLTFDDDNKIRFAHDSARVFILKLLDDVDKDSALFRIQDTHRRALRLFIQVFAPTNHSSPFVSGLAKYFSTNLSYHCQRSIQNALIYNKEWEILFEQVLDSYSLMVPSTPRLAFPTYPKEMSNQSVNWNLTSAGNIVRPVHPSFRDIPFVIKTASTELGYPWTKNISDEMFESLRDARENWGEQARYLERRLEGILSGYNLAAAVESEHNSAASFILHGSWSLQGPKGVLDLIEDAFDQHLFFGFLCLTPKIEERMLFERFINRCADDFEFTMRSGALRKQFLSGLAEHRRGRVRGRVVMMKRGKYIFRDNLTMHRSRPQSESKAHSILSRSRHR